MANKKVGTAHMPAHIKKLLEGSTWPCRYCEHMARMSPPKAHWVGGCEYQLRPGPRGGCPKFKTAKSFRK